MNYTVTPAEKSTVKIAITFTPEEWAAANDKAYLDNRKKFAVNGFRKGKVPKHVLEMYYGKGLFYEDALNDLFAEHYPAILEKEKENFTPVGDPALSVEEISDEKVVLTATTPVKPDVTIEKYTGIKIEKFEYTVTDADVDKEIDSTRERFAESVDVTDRAAQNGDTVNIDFEGKMDGVAFDGGSAQGYDLTLGAGQFIAGFEEQVVGMNVGETKDVNVTFPEDYQAENLKGKPAVFTVTVHKITGKVLPELNEEFAKKVGSDSVDAYRAKVRERLEKAAASRSLNETENSIITEIAKGATAEIPDAMIEKQEEYSMQRMEYSLMYQGIKLDDYLKYVNQTRDEYKKHFEEEARRTVLHQLIVEKLIKELNIEATEAEIADKVAEQAASVGKEAEEYRKTMDPRQLEYIEGDIKVTKLFDYLQANNEMFVAEAK
ncbi:MAG TPA: trigger factor [Firmicutes bacterium]|nr:trigger factor [Bacillota bacterium]